MKSQQDIDAGRTGARAMLNCVAALTQDLMMYARNTQGDFDNEIGITRDDLRELHEHVMELAYTVKRPEYIRANTSARNEIGAGL